MSERAVSARASLKFSLDFTHIPQELIQKKQRFRIPRPDFRRRDIC